MRVPLPWRLVLPAAARDQRGPCSATPVALRDHCPMTGEPDHPRRGGADAGRVDPDRYRPWSVHGAGRV